MAILSLIFKRAWQAQFLRHALVHKTKIVYFFKMYKWYYYHFLIFLLVSNMEKSQGSVHSRVQSSLTNNYTSIIQGVSTQSALFILSMAITSLVIKGRNNNCISQKWWENYSHILELWKIKKYVLKLSI